MSDLSLRPPPRPSSNKRPKLRTSCDECTESKLRCSKHKPTCDRCRSHGFKCIYSASQREFRTVSWNAHSQQNLVVSHQDGHSGINTSTEVPFEPAVLEPWLEKAQSPFSSLFTPNSFQEAEDFEINDSDQGPWSSMYQQPDRPGQGEIAKHESPNPRVESSAASLTQPCPISTSPAMCKCPEAMAEKLLLAKSLRYDEKATADVLLDRSKHATEICSRVLQCRQRSKEDSDLLLLASLLAAILNIFAQLCQRPQAPQSLPSYTTASPACCSSTSAPSQFNIGIYQLDQQDMDNLKMSIAAIEIRKVRVLLKDFDTLVQHRQFSSHADGRGNQPDSLASIPQALSFKLQTTFEAIMHGLL